MLASVAIRQVDDNDIAKGEVYPKIKFSPVVVFGVLSRSHPVSVEVASSIGNKGGREHLSFLGPRLFDSAP